MKITKDMLHKDLQSFYRVGTIAPALIKRPWGAKLVAKLMNLSKGKNVEGLDCDERFIASGDGRSKIRVRVYRPQDCTEALPAMLYIHGGGYLMGNPEGFAGMIKKFIETRKCVVIAPDYRKAFTEPFPAGFNDCYESLIWAKENAEQLGIRNDRFMVAGHSAGGGLTAAVTLKARDTKEVDIAFQMPIYPMIDDLQPVDASRQMVSPIWSTQSNALGWSQYLKALHNKYEAIPAYAAPARNTDYSNFPPTITFVGDCEPFCEETQRYVEALKTAEVEVAFKLYEGCFHGFDMIASKTGIGKDALGFTFNQYGQFYDRFVKGAAQVEETNVETEQA